MSHTEIPVEYEKILDDLKQAIVDIDEDGAVAIAEKIISLEINPNLAIRYSLAQGAIGVGEKFDSGEIFLPHLVMAGDLMDRVSKILEKNIQASDVVRKKTIILATVEGDMHSVGKNLVGTMLKAGGFNVVDMGVDVTSAQIIQKANDTNADMIALSSLLTTTMPYQKEVIDDLVAMGIRDKFKVMIGGGPVTKEYADQIRADAYGRDALEAVDVAKVILK